MKARLSALAEEASAPELLDVPWFADIRVAIRWAIASVVLSGIAQLWAGSGASPGQGDGFVELMLWSAIFGAIAVIMTSERARNGEHPVDADRVWSAALWGFGIAGVLAIAWFSAKGGPTAGDWFVGPAGAALAVGLVLYVRPARP